MSSNHLGLRSVWKSLVASCVCVCGLSSNARFQMRSSPARNGFVSSSITRSSSKYRLDNESRQLRDLERRGNRCIDVRRAKREGVYFGFQGVLNPVVADDSSSKVFVLQQPAYT